MAFAMTILKLLLALLLSLIATFAVSAVYVLFPLIVLLLTRMLGAQQSDGISAVGGGGQSRPLLILEPIFFVIIFLFLNRRHRLSEKPDPKGWATLMKQQ